MRALSLILSFSRPLTSCFLSSPLSPYHPHRPAALLQLSCSAIRSSRFSFGRLLPFLPTRRISPIVSCRTLYCQSTSLSCHSPSSPPSLSPSHIFPRRRPAFFSCVCEPGHWDSTVCHSHSSTCPDLNGPFVLEQKRCLKVSQPPLGRKLRRRHSAHPLGFQNDPTTSIEPGHH